jgi:hypothetical protein
MLQLPLPLSLISTLLDLPIKEDESGQHIHLSFSSLLYNILPMNSFASQTCVQAQLTC